MSAFAQALIDEIADTPALAEQLKDLLKEPTTPSSTSPWMTVDEAADYLRCPRSRIYALRSAQRIPYHHDGSRLLLHKDELDQWVRAGGGIRP